MSRRMVIFCDQYSEDDEGAFCGARESTHVDAPRGWLPPGWTESAGGTISCPEHAAHRQEEDNG